MIDLHNHTFFGDGRDSPSDMIEEAHRKGVHVFGLSEHFPRPRGYDYPEVNFNHEGLASRFFDYISEVSRLKEGRGDIKVLLGTEVDFLPDETERIGSEIGAFNFDYIIGGVHMIGKWGFDYNYKEWQGRDVDDLYNKYYEIMYQLIKSRLFDIIAHFDLIKIFKKRYPPKKDFSDVSKDLLREVAKAGLFLEVNTGTLRKDCAELSPSPELIREAARLKIPFVLGSDAHRTEDIAYGFGDVVLMLKGLGVKETAYFEKRRPVFVKL